MSEANEATIPAAASSGSGFSMKLLAAGIVASMVMAIA